MQKNVSKNSKNCVKKFRRKNSIIVLKKFGAKNAKKKCVKNISCKKTQKIVLKTFMLKKSLIKKYLINYS